MPNVRIKICGITRIEDALAAAVLGADAIGLVFYAKSPRAVDIEKAQKIVRALPPFVTTVGLFVDAQPGFIDDVLHQVPLDLLQFHGNEPPADCERHARPYLKALRMAPDADIAEQAARYASAAGILLDAYTPGIPGGTGIVFDWSRIPPISQPLILAGGLNAENVRAAIEQVKPYAVDVSGGVELEKGIKDIEKIREFVRQVRQR